MLVSERLMLKLLLSGEGVVLSLTLKSRSFFFFLTPSFVGARVAPTTDPYPGIVELCNYNVRKIIKEWERLHLVKLVVKDAQSNRLGDAE
jgi:hypothetical protein